MYYLSYAFCIIIFLWHVINNKNLFNIKKYLNNNFIKFVSSHTMWIYLWHIFILDILSKELGWGIRFILVSAISLLITYIQSNVIKKIGFKNQLLKTVLDC